MANDDPMMASVAGRYASALFDLANDERKLAEVEQDVIRVERLMGDSPDFVRMVCDLIQERISKLPVRPAIGQFGANHDVCPVDCCPAPVMRRPMAAPSLPV